MNNPWFAHQRGRFSVVAADAAETLDWDSIPPASLGAAAVVLAALAAWLLAVAGPRAAATATNSDKVTVAAIAALVGALALGGMAATSFDRSASGPTEVEIAEGGETFQSTPTPAAGGSSTSNREATGGAEPTTAPTARPAPSPTPQPSTTTRPSPTPQPSPTPVPPPPILEIPPLPTVRPGEFDFQQVGVGPVRLDLYRGVQFVLGTSRLVYSTDGLAGFALDGDFTRGEVDIFVPYRSVDGSRPSDSFDVAVAMGDRDIEMELLYETEVDGNPALVYQARTSETQPFLVFDTAPATVGVPDAGWFAAAGQTRVWLIDTPDGPLVVTAEARTANVADFNAAIDLAEDILFTMTIL